MRSVLSVYLPRWSLRLAARNLRRQPGPAPPGNSPRKHAAILLVSNRRGVQTVACCCERAEASGVRPGLTLAHARALLSGVTAYVQPFTPDEDAKQLHRLARWALRFSPNVAPDAPDGLFLELTGCERVFGEAERHLELIDASLQRLGFATRLARAPTYGCAWAVARYGQSRIATIPDDGVRNALASLPVAALRIDEQTVSTLAAVGIQRIAELLALPRVELAARFGTPLLRRIDEGIGDRVELVESLTPEARLEVVRAFDGPLTRLKSVELAVAELLQALLDRLKQHGTALRRLDLNVRRANSTPTRLTIALSYPTRNREFLWSLLRPRLERLPLGFGIEEIGLRAGRAEELPNEQLELWSEAGSQATNRTAALGALLDWLTERLGQNAIACFEAVETHVPERAFVSRLPLEATRQNRTLPDVCCAGRPSRLFQVPEPAQVISLAPDAPPAWFHWRGQGFRVLTGIGPERLEFPWWNEQKTSAGGRDYYQVQDEHGRWLWVFHSHESGRWFVQGEWA